MSDPISELVKQLRVGDPKALARCISLVENEAEGSDQILHDLILNKNIPVVGITGPPGAGKSSLLNMLVKHLVNEGKKIGVIAIDPSSPFNYGALLGDRIRLAEHFNSTQVFIRSLATRGSLGGLNDKIMEVTDLMRGARFDFIFVETVGVGQSEVEIAGLADTTIVVLVPESGDEVQTMKAGLMEIADIFVVNKGDRSGADRFVKNLRSLVHERGAAEVSTPVLKTVATKDEGVAELLAAIYQHQSLAQQHIKRFQLLTEKAIRLIASHRMKDIDHNQLLSDITEAAKKEGFNIYSFVKKYY